MRHNWRQHTEWDTDTIYKLALLLRHVRQDLRLLIGSDEPGYNYSQTMPHESKASWYSENVFSTNNTNFGSSFTKATTSLEDTTGPPAICLLALSLDSSLIPSASARRAFRLVSSHWLLHFSQRDEAVPEGVEKHCPHHKDCLRRPQGHDAITNASHDSSSGHPEGAWCRSYLI